MRWVGGVECGLGRGGGVCVGQGGWRVGWVGVVVCGLGRGVKCGLGRGGWSVSWVGGGGVSLPWLFKAQLIIFTKGVLPGHPDETMWETLAAGGYHMYIWTTCTKGWRWEGKGWLVRG